MKQNRACFTALIQTAAVSQIQVAAIADPRDYTLVQEFSVKMLDRT
jgi:hypothetical protein